MNKRYPLLSIRSDYLRDNSKTIIRMCKAHGIQVTGISKGFASIPECCKALSDGGCIDIGSSRIEHLRKIKEYNPSIQTCLIRIPMFSEMEDVINYADSCFVSEMETLRLLNFHAEKRKKKLNVILMRDVGDLREGFFYKEHLLKAALITERSLPYLHLYGIGMNIGCYGSVKPTFKNLNELSSNAEEIELLIGRKLDIISGGATTSFPIMMQAGAPDKINHLRLGECMYVQSPHWGSNYLIEELHKDVFQITAQIVELNKKPTMPIGERGMAAFGKTREYPDRGIRKRAIIAIGNQDLGDAKAVLKPLDQQIEILGASSDHTILDIEDCIQDYKLGDLVTFNLTYQGCLFASNSNSIYKQFISYDM